MYTSYYGHQLLITSIWFYVPETFIELIFKLPLRSPWYVQIIIQIFLQSISDNLTRVVEIYEIPLVILELRKICPFSGHLTTFSFTGEIKIKYTDLEGFLYIDKIRGSALNS